MSKFFLLELEWNKKIGKVGVIVVVGVGGGVRGRNFGKSDLL